jgi:flagellar hook-associated protein 1 FlgK
VASLTAGSAELPFFTDGFNPYSGAITKTGVQSVGLAGRIAVNPALLANPSRLVVYSTSPQTDSADGLRPNFIFNQLTQASLSFSPESGIGSTATPYTGPISSFMRQMLSIQGEAASNAESLATGQAVVVTALQERVASTSGVNVDQEMANLITLQTAYGANARILSTVKEMIETLMRM